jgi:hypothetical protein
LENRILPSRDETPDTASGPQDEPLQLLGSKALGLLLSTGAFEFSRTDGVVLADTLRLMADGTIRGYIHPNETSWTIDEAGLAFRNDRGVVTTLFDKLKHGEAGSLELLGCFLGGGRPEYIHRLVPRATPQLASVVNPAAQPVARPNKIAVLVRTYKCDEKYRSLMQKLDTDREGYDLYAIVDETHGRHDPGGWNAIWHSVAACRQLGLTQKHSDILRVCGDFPLYVALREIPEYTHYVMLEDDVELCGESGAYISELVRLLGREDRPGVDFAGVFFQADKTQIWGPETHKLFGPKNCYLARFPFVVVSKKLLAYMFLQRQVEAIRNPAPNEIMHCEVFAASAAQAGGFSCFDMNALIPGSYDKSMMMFESPGFGLPMGTEVHEAGPVRMYHPVYTMEEWVRRTKNRIDTLQGDKLSSFLNALAWQMHDAELAGDNKMVEGVQSLAQLLDPEWQAFINLPRVEYLLSARAVGDDDQWYPAEGGEGKKYRWSRTPKTIWKLPTEHVTGKIVRFAIPVVMELVPGSQEKSRLSVGGQVFALRRDVRALFCEIVADGLLIESVALLTESVHSPQALWNSDDTRELGFAVAVC